MQFIIVLPAFNEEQSIRDLVLRTSQQVDRVIVVDDGSSDQTCACLEGLEVALLRNRKNMGKGAALQRGFAAALELDPLAVLSMDSDGQHRPEDIPLFLHAFEENPDSIIIGARTINRSVSPCIRRFANRFADFWISWATGHRIRDSQSGFRLYPARLLRQVFMDPDTANTFVFESEMLIKAAGLGYYTKSVDIETIYRSEAGRSNYRPLADTWKITRMVALSLFRRGMYVKGLMRIAGLLPDPRVNDQR